MTDDPNPRRQPQTVTREELFRQVWETPMSRLATDYGISGNGLAKICDRLNVPYPPRGYWAKKAAGQKVVAYRLPPAKADTPLQATITPTPPPPKVPELPAEVTKSLESIRSGGEITVSERLARPHPVIAGWLDEHERKRLEARRERDPDRRRWMDPGEIDASTRRQHRILDALFKALEKQGGKVRQDERRELLVEMNGEKIPFQIREKQKQVRTPLSPADQRIWGRPWRQELKPSGVLTFVIKVYMPGALRTEWLESAKTSMESMLTDIVATFVAAGPLLVEQRKRREEEERQRQIAERKRYEEKQRRKRDDNRWRTFVQMAEQREEAELARSFLASLRASATSPDLEVEGMTIAEWIGWVERRIEELDPLNHGIESVFRTLGGVTEWSS